MKPFLLIFLFLLSSSSSIFSQAAADNCASAPLLSIQQVGKPRINFNVDWTTKSSSGIREHTPDVTSRPNVSYAGRDAWFKFNSGNYTYMNAQTRYEANSGSDFYYELQGINLFTFCDQSSSLGTVTIDGTEFFQLSPNTTYYVQRLQLNAPFGAADGNFTDPYQLYLFDEEPDYSCESPIVIPTPNPTLPTASLFISRPPVGVGLAYFTFTPAADYVIDVGGYDFLVSSGSCGDFTPVSGIGNFNLKANVTYYIISRTDREYFTLTKQAVNITPETAIPLTLGQANSYNHRAYPRDGFYTFTAPATGSIIMQNSTFTLVHPFPYMSDGIRKSETDGIAGMTPGQQYILRNRMSSSYSNFTAQEHTPTYLNQSCALATVLNPTGQTFNISLNKKTADTKLWYEITGNHNSLRVTTNRQELAVSLYVGNDCGTANEVFSTTINSVSTERIALPNTSEKHYLSIQTNIYDPFFSGTEISITITGETSAAALPVNDQCYTAIEWSQYTHSSTDFALANTTLSEVPDCNKPTTYDSPSVWYTYSPEGNGITELSWNVDVYQGVCNALTQIDCGFNTGNETRKVKLNPNAQYYMKVNTLSSNTVIANFTGEDSTCGNAEELALSEEDAPFPQYSLTAYDSTDPARCDDSNDPDAWWSFTTSTEINGLVLTSTGNTTSYVAMVYTGNCNSLTEVECVAAENEPTLFSLTPNTDYFLRLAAANIDQLNFKFVNVVFEDESCSTVTSIAISPDPYLIDKSQITENSGFTIGCDEAEPDIFKKFTCGPSGTIVVTSDNDNASSIPHYTELYSDCSTLVPNGCKSERNATYSGLTPGAEYILRTNTHPDYNSKTWIYDLPNSISNGSCSNAESITNFNCEQQLSGISISPDGAWYSCAMPTDEALVIQTGINFSGTIYYGTCASLVQYSTITANNEYTVDGLPAGTVIFINTTGENYHEFCISTTPGSSHENTVCDFSETISNIELLSCTTPNQVNIQRPSLTGNAVEFWYSFTAPSVSLGIAIAEIESNFAQIESYKVHESCGGTLLFAGLEDDETTLNNLVINQDYYLSIVVNANAIQSACNGTSQENCIQQLVDNSYINMEICLTSFPPPAANDVCDAAIAVLLSNASCSTAQSGDTQYSTDQRYNCSEGTRELWYSYHADEVKNVIIKTENSTTPLLLTLFKESCLGRQITCNSDSIILVTEADTDYIIAVSPLQPTANTAFELCLKELIIEGDTSNVGINVSTPVTKLQVNGGVAVGFTNVPLPGTIRYNGEDLEGFSIQGWKSLTRNNEDLSEFQDDLGNHQATTSVDMNYNTVKNLAEPIDATDAVTKSYVDLLKTAVIDSLSGLSALDSASVGIQNIYLNNQYRADGPGGTGPVNTLEFETTSGNFSLNIARFNGGWSFYVPGLNSSSFPTIFNDGNYVGIGIEEAQAPLHIHNDIARFTGGSTAQVIDFSADSGDLLIDAYQPSGNQNTPHMLMGNGMALGAPAAFDFDLGTKRLGIGLLNPTQALDIIGGIQVSTNSTGSSFQLNLIENNTGFARLNMTNSSNKDITLAALPSVTTASSRLNFFIEDAGNVMSILGSERVGINNDFPDYPLEVGTNTSNGNGAHVTNGGTWTNGSSRSFKENFQVISSKEILSKLANLEVLRWDYKDTDEGSHLGPIAEDFYAAFGLGNNEKYISTVDADGVALAAIKALHEENTELKKQLAAQEAKLQELSAQMMEFRQFMADKK